jgi:serine/threonine protein kinase
VDEYAGRVLAERYRLPRPPAEEFELVETRAFDTYSGQEVLVRQVLLPEVVSAELLGEDDESGDGEGLGESARRALDAARAAAAIPDHPRLVQVFDIFVEGGSLWIASELVSARPLAALLAERPMDAYRAAEVASDVLTALRALHAHGWTHRNVTAGTVLVCDDGRAMLGGLAAGAAQEALCGYDPLPEPVLAGGAEPDLQGPQSALEQERARQNRITVVGAVTERWAPEQAHEVHENWRLSPPVGPAADLWALGSLLFRSVQGHPPYPEENAAELVQLVCAEPPAFAEECGPLRPVVESLLRPDPEERPEAEELGGWLRSLIRSAPEPDLGVSTVQVPTDPARLPIKRRRGELVRRRRRAAAADAGTQHRRHARGKQARAGRPAKAPKPETPAKLEKAARPAKFDKPAKSAKPARSIRPSRTVETTEHVHPMAATRTAHESAPRANRAHIHEEDVVYRRPDAAVAAPRRLGVRLLVAVLVILAAVVAYALLVMPHRDTSTGGASPDRTVPAQMGSGGGDGKDSPKPSGTPSRTTAKPPTKAPTKAPTGNPPAAPALGPDYKLRHDTAGFTVAVHNGWVRTGENAQHEVIYSADDLQLTVVPGRDTSAADGTDPVAYQLNERELADFRSSSWSSASGLQSLTLSGHPAAEGEYTYRNPSGQSIYARNLAILVGGKYHIVLVTGLDTQRSAVQQAFNKAVQTYTAS